MIYFEYKESGVTNFKRMEDLLSNGRNLPLHAAARGQPKRLARLNLVQLLIKCRPQRELNYKGIKENIEAQSTATASISTIGRAVRNCLPEAKMT